MKEFRRKFEVCSQNQKVQVEWKLMRITLHHRQHVQNLGGAVWTIIPSPQLRLGETLLILLCWSNLKIAKSQSDDGRDEEDDDAIKESQITASPHSGIFQTRPLLWMGVYYIPDERCKS